MGLRVNYSILNTAVTEKGESIKGIYIPLNMVFTNVILVLKISEQVDMEVMIYTS